MIVVILAYVHMQAEEVAIKERLKKIKGDCINQTARN